MGLGTSRRTVLVTGAAGFLGSHLVDRLLAEGFEVVGLDNLMTGNLANLTAAGKDPRFHFEIGDVRETLKVYAEVIFNFASPASPVHYQSDPYATLTTNVLGALRLVEHVRARRCRIVHASTSEVYGDPLEHPQRETYWGHVNPIGDRACYDEGKRTAETILHDAARVWRADARLLRIFNTYGPRMAIDDGRVVSSFLVQAIKGERITVHGSGDQTRSFCFVSDIIEATFRAAVVTDFVSPMNIGNPRESTILELAEAAMRAAGRRVEVIRAPLPSDDPKRRCPDLARARQCLGWDPSVELESGLALTHDDFLERLGDH
jgi:UDP-glucuronate decarboxylase